MREKGNNETEAGSRKDCLVVAVVVCCWLVGWLAGRGEAAVRERDGVLVCGGGGFILAVVACFAMVDWIRRSRTIEEDGPTLSNYTNFQDRIFGSFIPSTN